LPEEERSGRFMTEEAWRALWNVISVVTPATRIEMGQAGEPTLHPRLPEFIGIAREISPWSQITVITNGTMLAKGKVSFEDLLGSGANIVYVDMYNPEEEHVALAEASGYQWYKYHNKPSDAPGAWVYSGPDLKLIVLMEHPGNWPESRKKKNRLGTFFNHLDWKAAAKFGMYPVEEPVEECCTQPFRYVSMNVDGEYTLCCQDFIGETAGMFGSVFDGPEGFLRFWFSDIMQQHRRWLWDKNRAASPWCSRCNISFSRGYRMWNGNQFRIFWDSEKNVWAARNPEDMEMVELTERHVDATMDVNDFPKWLAPMKELSKMRDERVEDRERREREKATAKRLPLFPEID
jgi:hypothetical protein